MDAQCDKLGYDKLVVVELLNVDRRKYCQLYSTDSGLCNPLRSARIAFTSAAVRPGVKVGRH